MTPSLSPQRIAALCDPAARSVALEVVPETGSTNADLLGRLDSLQGPLLLVAEKQTAGRGRAGRSWLSAPGASLTFFIGVEVQPAAAGVDRFAAGSGRLDRTDIAAVRRPGGAEMAERCDEGRQEGGRRAD
ncbi:hypothetical protein ACFS07_03095 [Undibacterium arcticum]